MENQKLSLGLKKTLISQELSMLDLKASGHNTHSDYKYLELGDFMPQLLKLFAKYKVYTNFDFGNDERAILSLHDAEDINQKPIMTGIKIVEIKLRACNDMQNIGGVHTYARRYLYFAMFDIVENDILNQSQPETTTKQEAMTKQEKKISQKQIAYIYKLLSDEDIKGEKADKSILFIINKMIKAGQLTSESKKDIPASSFDLFIQNLSTMIDAVKKKESTETPNIPG